MVWSSRRAFVAAAGSVLSAQCLGAPGRRAPSDLETEYPFEGPDPLGFEAVPDDVADPPSFDGEQVYESDVARGIIDVVDRQSGWTTPADRYSSATPAIGSGWPRPSRTDPCDGPVTTPNPAGIGSSDRSDSRRPTSDSLCTAAPEPIRRRRPGSPGCIRDDVAATTGHTRRFSGGRVPEIVVDGRGQGPTLSRSSSRCERKSRIVASASA